MDPVKEAFIRIKEEIFSLRNEISALNLQLSALKTRFDGQTIPSHNQSNIHNPTDNPAQTPTVPQEIRGFQQTISHTIKQSDKQTFWADLFKKIQIILF